MTDTDNLIEAMREIIDVAVCQFCGRTHAIDEEVATKWLVSPQRGANPLGLLIIRCPAHISEWSMRQSVAGRSYAMRERARQGKQREQEPLRAVDPIPALFRGAQTKGKQ